MSPLHFVQCLSSDKSEYSTDYDGQIETGLYGRNSTCILFHFTPSRVYVELDMN